MERVVSCWDKIGVIYCFFFFSSRRRHTRCSRDWSSDVCSSDLEILAEEEVEVGGLEIERIGSRLVELDPRHHHEDVAVVLFQLDAGARRERVLDGEGVKLEYLLQEGMLMQVGTVDVHPQLALTRAHDLAQPGGREASLDPPVGPPIDAGRPVFGRLWC